MISYFRKNALEPGNAMAVLPAPDYNRLGGLYPASVEGEQQHVYVVGTIQARFPSLSVEKEFFQAIPSANAGSNSTTKESGFNVSDEVGLLQLNLDQGLTASLYTVLSRPENLYIAREMCWTLVNSDGNEIYSVIPTSNIRLKQLIAAIKTDDNNMLLPHVAVGSVKQGFSNPSCLTDSVPAVMLANLTQASTDKLIKLVTSLDSSIDSAKLKSLLQEILSLNANDGITDHDRALNYVLYNNPSLFLKVYQHLYGSDNDGPNPSGYQLTDVRTQWAGSSARKVVRVIFDFAGINSGATQSWYSAVDVAGEFPFLLTSYSRYLQRD